MSKKGKNVKFSFDSKLSESDKKYCRCVLKVAAKQLGECNVDKAWYETRGGKRSSDLSPNAKHYEKKCYNPYAVCAHSTGGSSRECGKNYNFRDLSVNELTAYAQLTGIIKTTTYDKETLIAKIQSYKRGKTA